MIEILITENQIKRAKKLYSFNNLNNSITKGKNEIYGAIGEIITLDFYNKESLNASYVGSFDYDLRIFDKRVDVKTKKVNNAPKLNHNATIPAANTKQKTDIYLFVYVLSDFTKAFLVGWLPKDLFFETATLKRKGEFDGNTSFQYRADTYSTTLDKLYAIK